MHADKREEKIKGRGGPGGKAIVMGLLERHGEVRAKVVETRTGKDLKSMIRENVERGSDVFTDQLKSYIGVDRNYLHHVINHAERYVQGRVHTNGIENFWSLLKRGLTGTYISVEPFHLFRYLDEQSFRFNARKGTDAERFLAAVSSISGRRLQYQQLIGQTCH
jgi:transposase-like protein